MKTLGKLGIAGLCLACATALPASANSQTQGSQASVTALSHIADGSVVVLKGSGTVIEGGSQLVVASATVVGESTVVVLRNLSTGAEMVLEATGEGLSALSALAGRTVHTIVTAAGTIIAEGAKVVLFIPAKTAGALFEAAAYTGQ